ncbi:MAG: hypothetical protein CMF94_00640 [Candidatus Marinimicrobia bacterium]|nr:hypothetical protein [Candidatus Neomarinimicrobiota bacterium]
MLYRNQYLKIPLVLFFICINLIFSTQVQLITAHKKSNGVLLRIVTNSIVDIENIAGWKGQENWFYLTLNGSYLSPKALEDLSFEFPLVDIEITENNQSVQIGYLFNTPIEDFEIFHSNASRVLLVQVWESLSDSLRSEVKLSEGTNINRVFTLPKNESKGSPFYDSFVYARNKYGPEKYFVWYNNWYSTQDSLDIDSLKEVNNQFTNASNNYNEPKPFKYRKRKVNVSGPPPPPKTLKKDAIDISFILDEGLLLSGSKRSRDVKALQEALISLGYYLGEGGVYNDGVDGEFGPNTEDAVIQFQLDRGFNSANVDGIVGEGTHKELLRALSGERSLASAKRKIDDSRKNDDTKKVDMGQTFGSVMQQSRETAKELLNQAPVTTQVKREKRRLQNINEINLLPPDLSKRKTFLRLTCNLDGANVFIDGSLIGTTPLLKKLPITPGWHRVRVVDPLSPPPKFAMDVPDYQDIYVPKGRTQKIRINLATSNQESLD